MFVFAKHGKHVCFVRRHVGGQDSVADVILRKPGKVRILEEHVNVRSTHLDVHNNQQIHFTVQPDIVHDGHYLVSCRFDKFGVHDLDVGQYHWKHCLLGSYYWVLGPGWNSGSSEIQEEDNSCTGFLTGHHRHSRHLLHERGSEFSDTDASL